MTIEPIRRRIPHPLLPILVLVAGCGEGTVGPTVYPVSGKILVDGKPAAKARITFHPSSGPATELTPYAEAEDDGSFRPTTRLSHDGAPAGDYTLTIIWPEIKVDHGEEIALGDRLGAKYAYPRSSNLKVTIKEGENALPPLELTSIGSTSPGDRSRR